MAGFPESPCTLDNYVGFFVIAKNFCQLTFSSKASYPNFEFQQTYIRGNSIKNHYSAIPVLETTSSNLTAGKTTPPLLTLQYRRYSQGR